LLAHSASEVQNIALQGYAGKLNKCSVCHGYTPEFPGPHGFIPSGIELVSGNVPGITALQPVFPNPACESVTIPFTVVGEGKIYMEIYSSQGKYIETVVHENLVPGSYQVKFAVKNLSNGVYFCVLKSTDSKDNIRFVVSK
jgi:hypothetical protein